MRHAVVMDQEHMYRAIQSKDSRFDGLFYVAVTTTGIYCRPSCPAITPKRVNVQFYPTPAAAQHAGFRACKRCRPDAAPGSPEWSIRSDIVARAMRLIADGVVDREGVGGLASRLGYSERQLNRHVTNELGTGPLAIARAQRAQTARILVETTEVPMAEVAFASGFSSLRQFNATMTEVFALSPSELRRRSASSIPAATAGRLSLRLPYRPPISLDELFGFFARRQIAGVEEASCEHLRRTISLPHGYAVVELRSGGGPWIDCHLELMDLRDLAPAVQRSRRLLDLDSDPQAIELGLGTDEFLGPIVRKLPGLRVPGHLDGAELAMRTVLGQQVSVESARRQIEQLTLKFGKPITTNGSLTHLFPEAEVIAELGDGDLPMPRSRARALRELALALSDGSISLDPGTARDDVCAKLLSIPGVGPWTVAYIRMRALNDPDVFLPGDLGIKQALALLGLPTEIRDASELATRWRPWRSYATHYLWTQLKTRDTKRSRRH